MSYRSWYAPCMIRRRLAKVVDFLGICIVYVGALLSYRVAPVIMGRRR